ncbi:sugar transferase [Candidatus Microgenomates bacterium]|nr:sugar transferase [Candidatus Microgenomates bacterium]
MVTSGEIKEDRKRLHAVIDRRQGRGLSYAVSKERKFYSRLFAGIVLLPFLPQMGYWAAKVSHETGQSPFFDNGFDYEYQEGGHVVRRHYGKLKIASLESGTVEQELAVRSGGGHYEPVTHDDARITKTGRVMRPKAHDESTQFLNMISGQMGLVGLRTGKVEFKLNILANGDSEPFCTYLSQLRKGLLPGFIPVHVTCPDTRRIPVERRLWLETYYAQYFASFLNDCQIAWHFIRHRSEVLR